MKPATRLSMFFLSLVAVAHLVRVVLGVPVVVGHFDVPMWGSILAAIVTAGLAMALWREHRTGAG